MNKTTAFLLCLAFVFASAAEVSLSDDKYVIDQATDILVQLLDDAQQNQEDLDNNWAINKPILQANIDAVTVQLQNKQQECAGISDVLEGHKKELEDALKYFNWLNDRVKENVDRIAQILAQRCEQNGNFVEALKNDKLALKLVDFLRAQIQAKESFDLAQRKAFMKKLTSFLAVYRRGNLAELIELEKQVASDYEVDVDYSVQGRTDEEIGTGHVDNDQGELELSEFENGERQGWPQIKAELLALLNSLENTINQKIIKAQEDEIASSSAAAEYKLHLEHEIQVYTKEINKYQAIIDALVKAIAEDEANLDRCNSEENSLEAALATAEDDLQTAQDDYDHKSQNLAEEIEIFTEVLNLYNVSTGDQGDDFKERANDYLDDGNFDNEEYDAREVPEIDLLSDSN